MGHINPASMFRSGIVADYTTVSPSWLSKNTPHSICIKINCNIIINVIMKNISIINNFKVYYQMLRLKTPLKNNNFIV